MENDNLKKQMKELFRLFKKMVDKYPLDSIPGIDKTQIEQLKIFLSNYDNIKDELSVDSFGPFDNEITQKIISTLINKLREQLGEDAYEVEEETVIDKKEKEFKSLPTEDRYIALLDAIDNELRNPNLSMEEIDTLLDKRAKIQDGIYKKLTGK